LKIKVSSFRAQHRVQADKGGLRRPFRDSAPKAGSPVGFFCQIPHLPVTLAVAFIPNQVSSEIYYEQC